MMLNLGSILFITNSISLLVGLSPFLQEKKKELSFLPCPCRSKKYLMGFCLWTEVRYFLILWVSGVNYLMRN
jgi:hypothetical protein